jgi:DNA helicase HerA-like ATPase
MSREVVIILGKTGFGKSTWLAEYAARFTRLFAFDPFGKFPANYWDGDFIIERAQDGNFEPGRKFRVGSYNRNDLELLGALAFLSGDCLFVIEEAGFIWGKGERIPDWLREIVFLGRHKNVSLAITAQRAAYIPIDLRSQANRLVTYWQTEMVDVGWLENYLGERVNEIPMLPKYVCLDAEDNKISRYKIRLANVPQDTA